MISQCLSMHVYTIIFLWWIHRSFHNYTVDFLRFKHIYRFTIGNHRRLQWFKTCLFVCATEFAVHGNRSHTSKLYHWPYKSGRYILHRIWRFIPYRLQWKCPEPTGPVRIYRPFVDSSFGPWNWGDLLHTEDTDTTTEILEEAMM